jgi:hypothetical protein
MSKKNKQLQEDYNNLIITLRGLTVQELLLLYIEAKTGSERDVDNIPVSILDSIDELGELLNKFYAERTLNDIFK